MYVTNKDHYVRTCIDYTEHYVVSYIHELNPICYAGIMINALYTLL